MKGPPLGPGGEDITWSDHLAPRGRKASSTRKIKPQTSNLNLWFWKGWSKTGAHVKRNGPYVKAEPNSGAEVHSTPPSQPKENLQPESDSLFGNNVGAEPGPPLQLACPTGGQRRKNKMGRSAPPPPRTPESDQRLTDEPVRLLVRQIGTKKVARLQLLGHLSVRELDKVIFAFPDADVDDDVVAEPVCYPQ